MKGHVLLGILVAAALSMADAQNEGLQHIDRPTCPTNYQPSRTKCKYGLSVARDLYCCPTCIDPYSIVQHPSGTPAGRYCYLINRDLALSCCRKCILSDTYYINNPGNAYVCNKEPRVGFCCRPKCTRPYRYYDDYQSNSACQSLSNGGYCCKPRFVIDDRAASA